MGWFDEAVDEVQGWFGDKQEAQKQPAAPAKDPNSDIEVQRAQQDVQIAQQQLDKSKQTQQKAQEELKRAQDEAAKATEARNNASSDGGAKVPGSSAEKNYQKTIKAEEAAKAKLAKAQKYAETMAKEVSEREGDLRQMKYRLEQAKTKASQPH